MKMTPEGYLKIDEELLMKAERGEAGESLRFWESKEYFVCLGRASKENEDCRIDNCRRDGVKILKRVSGGGTVLQGPGCLNYSLVLAYSRDASFGKINSSYGTILGGIAAALKNNGINAERLGISDIAVGGRKFSGNAQARKKKYFLHHGTFLLDFDIEKISRYLKHPKSEPAYRAKRKHSDFLANLAISREELINIINAMF